MAHVSHLRPAVRPARTISRPGRLTQSTRYRRPRRVGTPAAMVALMVLLGGGLLLLSSGASLSPDDNALAHVGLPLGGGKIQSVKVLLQEAFRRIRHWSVEVVHGECWEARSIRSTCLE